MYLSAFKRYITVTNISKSFYLQDGGKINWHRYGTKEVIYSMLEGV